MLQTFLPHYACVIFCWIRTTVTSISNWLHMTACMRTLWVHHVSLGALSVQREHIVQQSVTNTGIQTRVSGAHQQIVDAVRKKTFLSHISFSCSLYCVKDCASCPPSLTKELCRDAFFRRSKKKNHSNQKQFHGNPSISCYFLWEPQLHLGFIIFHPVINVFRVDYGERHHTQKWVFCL